MSDQTTSDELEKHFANLIYSDVMACDSANQVTLNPPLQSTALCGGVYSECGYTEVNDKTLDTNHTTSDTHVVRNGTEADNRVIMKGAASDPEKVNDHEQPLHLDDAGRSTSDENGYSTLDPSHYSQIQPYIGVSNSGVQFPSSDDDYLRIIIILHLLYSNLNKNCYSSRGGVVYSIDRFLMHKCISLRIIYNNYYSC